MRVSCSVGGEKNPHDISRRGGVGYTRDDYCLSTLFCLPLSLLASLPWFPWSTVTVLLGACMRRGPRPKDPSTQKAPSPSLHCIPGRVLARPTAPTFRSFPLVFRCYSVTFHCFSVARKLSPSFPSPACPTAKQDQSVGERAPDCGVSDCEKKKVLRVQH